MMAPAVSGAGIPSAWEIPIRARPSVPAEPHDPTTIETAEVMTIAHGRKMEGAMTFSP